MRNVDRSRRPKKSKENRSPYPTSSHAQIWPCMQQGVRTLILEVETQQLQGPTPLPRLPKLHTQSTQMQVPLVQLRITLPPYPQKM